MSGVQVFQTLSGSLYLLVITAVGIRLLLLAKRTREAPEFLLGCALLLGGTLGASLEGGGTAIATQSDPLVGGPLLMLGKCCGLMGMMLQAIFIRKVFRPEGKATLFVVVVVAILVGGPLLGYWRDGIFLTGSISTFWLWVEYAGRVVCPIWMFVEATRYFALMRRRVRIGLASPIVANRFLLWSIASVSGLIMLSTALPPILLDRIEYATLLAADMFIFSLSGIVTATCYWLVLMPPAWYRELFRSSDSATA